ncbi:MAG: AMP-binding protein [Nevskiales bacterium]
MPAVARMMFDFDLAARRARLTPERPVLYWRGRWFSYGELDIRARRLAGRLAERGVTKGDRVSILALNHIAHIDLILAAPKLGFIYAPFNYRLSAAEQGELARYVEPSLLLHDAQHAPIATATAAVLQPLADYENWLAAAPDAPAAPALSAEDPMMMLFTGGSTGLPKGAVLPYRQIFSNAVNTTWSWNVGGDDCVIQATPAFHAAINVLATPLLHTGGRIVLMESFEAGAYLRLLGECGATLLFMVPSMYQTLAEHPGFAAADFSSVRWAIAGGAPCPPPIRERYAARGIRFRLGYGLTEAGVNCFSISETEAARHPDSVGRPMLYGEAVIRHADGTPVQADEIGELTLAGPHLALGYFRREPDTAASFRDGWLWTGDLARQDGDGLFYICGRRKEMYISGGENVYPAEIEGLLHTHPAVAECAVLGVPDARWGETGLAALALKSGERLSGSELQAWLRSRLAGYKRPRHILFLETLPKSGAGKILKPEIRQLYEQQHRATGT